MRRRASETGYINQTILFPKPPHRFTQLVESTTQNYTTKSGVQKPYSISAFTSLTTKMSARGLKGPILEVKNMYKTSSSQYAIVGDENPDSKFHITVRLGGTERSTPPKNPDALIRSTKDISELETANIVVPRSAIPVDTRCIHLAHNAGACRSGSCYLLEHGRVSDPPGDEYPRAWMGTFGAKVRWDVDGNTLWLINIEGRDNNDGRLIILRSEKWEKNIHPHIE
jgi:hypothetical protein